MTSKLLSGLIILTTAIFIFVNVIVQEYLIAVCALALGLLWLILETKKKQFLSSIFFLFFVALTIVGSLHNIPIPIMLLALITSLVAWDLSRFQVRILHEVNGNTRSTLEAKHLQKLAATTFIGFLLALLPMFVQISLNFAVFLVIVLLLILVLRKSILYLRDTNERRTNG